MNFKTSHLHIVDKYLIDFPQFDNYKPKILDIPSLLPKT